VVPKTLSELLAKVFNESKLYLGEKFYPDGFSIDPYDHEIRYDSSDVDQESLTDKDFQGSEEFGRPFQAHVSAYCCGLLEIGEFNEDLPTDDPAINEALMRVWLAELNTSYGLVFCTTVPEQLGTRKLLESVGFQDVATYNSVGTGNRITVLMKDFTESKELPTGDNLEFEEQDYD